MSQANIHLSGHQIIRNNKYLMISCINISSSTETFTAADGKIQKPQAEEFILMQTALSLEANGLTDTLTAMEYLHLSLIKGV